MTHPLHKSSNRVRNQGTLKNNFLWSNALAQTPSLEPETRKTTADRIKNAADSLASVGSGCVMAS